MAGAACWGPGPADASWHKVIRFPIFFWGSLSALCLVGNGIEVLDLSILAEHISEDLGVGVQPQAVDKDLAEGRVHVGEAVDLLPDVGVPHGGVAEQVDELVLGE